MSTEISLDRWKQMAAEGSAQHLLAREHALHLYYGIDQAGLPIFFALTSLRPRLPLLRGVMTSSTRQRGDGQFVATLTLANSDYADTFMRMCMELARRTLAEVNEDEAFAAFELTLKQWQRLLAHRGTRPFSDRQVRGLLGELRFARKYLGPKLGARQVIAIWEGPLGAPQDFRDPALGLFEIKSVQANATSVLISSVRQLDPSSEDRIHLVTVEIGDDQLGASDNTVSLHDEVESMRKFIGQDAASLELFEDRLAVLGLDVSEPQYAEKRFVFGGLVAYQVEGDFPRLRAANTPLGVDDITYRVRLDHLTSFACAIDEALLTENDDGLGLNV